MKRRSRTQPAWAALVLGAAVYASGCSGLIGDPSPVNSSSEPGQAPENPGRSPETGPIDSNEGALLPLHKRWLDDSAAPNPLRRLTVQQLLYAVQDLTSISLNADDLPTETHRDGFVTFASSQVTGDAAARAFLRAATQAANTAPIEGIVSCTDYDELCLDTMLDGFASRVFRRPLTEDEKSRYRTVYNAALGLGAETALRYVARALLSSPNFLYRMQSHHEAPGKRGYAMAEKLAFFLWSSVPDATLLADAAAGRLDTPDGRRSAAQRMLADPKAERTVDAFHRQWLRFDLLRQLSPAADTFPEFNSDIAQSYEQEILHFARSAFFDEGAGTFRDLFAARHTFVNDTLAQLYGYPSSDETGYRKVDTLAEPRAGILMQGGLLAQFSTLRRSEPIFRGFFLLKQVLCRDLELPGDINVALPERDPSATYREQLETTTSPAFCDSCHSRINPLGFALDNFDGLGRYQPQENGQRIDTTVTVAGLGDLNGSYADGAELMAALAESNTAAECYTEKWFEFALGRARKQQDDQNAFNAILTAFEASERNLQALLLAIVSSDAF